MECKASYFHKFKLLMLFVCYSIVSCSGGTGGTGEVKLVGNVANEQGAGIDSAEVRLNRTGETVKTNKDGYFEIYEDPQFVTVLEDIYILVVVRNNDIESNENSYNDLFTVVPKNKNTSK